MILLILLCAVLFGVAGFFGYEFFKLKNINQYKNLTKTTLRILSEPIMSINYKNIIYKGYVKYKEITKILSLYKVYLKTYSKKVFVRSKNIELGNYMSPLKLSEYLAFPGVLFASVIQVYRHILNNNNSIIIKKNSVLFSRLLTKMIDGWRFPFYLRINL